MSWYKQFLVKWNCSTDKEMFWLLHFFLFCPPVSHSRITWVLVLSWLLLWLPSPKGHTRGLWGWVSCMLWRYVPRPSIRTSRPTHRFYNIFMCTQSSPSFLNLEKKNPANNGLEPKLREFRATWTCSRFCEPIEKTQAFPGPACSQVEQEN